jgi:beta-lysine 5,6-aminomutase beta subunit
VSTIVKPYGDTLDDGSVQLSFTLPVEWSEAADEAARQLVTKMGFSDVTVAEGRRIASGFSFFVVYARTPVGVDITSISTTSAKVAAMSMEDVDAFVRERIGRKVRVAGACIGTDAHTVGIDAILNMKGYQGDYGLERYKEFTVFNLGSQISVEELVRFAEEQEIDALLASQVVTQKGSDITGAGHRRAARITGRDPEGERHHELHRARRAARGGRATRSRPAAVRRSEGDEPARRGAGLRRRIRARHAPQRRRIVHRAAPGGPRRGIAAQ